MFPSNILCPLVALLVLLLFGCDGNSKSKAENGRRDTPMQPETSLEPVGQMGFFEDSNKFHARCANPETGTDPFTGLSYAEAAGSEMLEKMWLRSFLHEYYLWSDRVVDISPEGLSLEEYFRKLLVPEDIFSGYQELSLAESELHGRALSYGIRWAFDLQDGRVVLLIADVAQTSPYFGELRRGDVLEKVDGLSPADLAHMGLLDLALTPTEDNEQQSLEFRRPGMDEPLEITLTAADLDIPTVQRYLTLTEPTQPIGYLQFDRHLERSDAELREAVEQFYLQGVTDLILDLRYNGGGRMDVANRLAFMLAGPEATTGQVFYHFQSNGKLDGDEQPFLTTTLGEFGTEQELPSLNLERVFVLTGRDTCSASEAIINGLRGVGVDIYQFGASTCGKPYTNVPRLNCGRVYNFPMFKGTNALGYGDFVEGFIPSDGAPLRAENVLPGCTVVEDFQHELGDPAEAVLAAALYFREHGTCPEIPQVVMPLQLRQQSLQVVPAWRVSQPQASVQQPLR